MVLTWAAGCPWRTAAYCWWPGLMAR